MNLPSDWQLNVSPPLIILLSAFAIVIIFAAYILLFFSKTALPKGDKKPKKPARSNLKPLLAILLAVFVILVGWFYLYPSLNQLSIGWQQALSSPLVLLLLALMATTLLVVFIVPIIVKATSGVRTKKIKKTTRRNLKPAVTLISIILITSLGGYLYYYLTQPVRTITAAQFKLEKGKEINQLQEEKRVNFREVGLYLVDIRTRQEYANDHVKRSVSYPVEKIPSQFYPPERITIVVYSSDKRSDEARKAAEAIKVNGTMVKKAGYKVGRILVIKGGFEGLKKAGLATESGPWD